MFAEEISSGRLLLACCAVLLLQLSQATRMEAAAADRFRSVFVRDDRHHSCTERLLCLLGSQQEQSAEQARLIRGLSWLADNDVHAQEGGLSRTLLAAFVRGRSSGDGGERRAGCETTGCHLGDDELLRAAGFGGGGQPGRQGRSSMYGGGGGQRRTKVRVPNINMRDLFKHPLRTPPGSEYRGECRACEAKRSACTLYGLGTYGVCGMAWVLGGNFGSTACNIVTFPRSLDCYYNSFQNCYLQDCGLININLDFLSSSSTSSS